MTFDEAFDKLIGHEGAYVNNPNDPGGETNWGISKRSYPNINIKDLTREGAKLIYKKDFWDVLDLEGFTNNLRFQIFDFAVNSGIETAIRHLQKVINVADDGHWGPISKAAASLFTENELIMGLNAERLEFMTRLSIWDKFGRGWARRIAQNLRLT